ncbi:MAG: 3-methyl-2-oxobutanoate hydroxymethyltransferase, partial [Rhodospirillales bacterium]
MGEAYRLPAGFKEINTLSTHALKKRKSVTDIRSMKGGTPIVSLTAYTSLTGVLLDEHVDFLLVGDSLGMVLY